MPQYRRIELIVIIMTVLIVFTARPAAAQLYARPPWDGVSRFTVLLAGLDRRPSEEKKLSYRADAIMLVSLDPATQTLGVLSIPRDMHFAAPDTGDLLPVNTLLVRGEARQAGYGPYYMMDTLQYNLGIYVDSYLIFDFEAFITVIDALGGIEIDVPTFIRDDSFPDMNFGYDPLVLTPGRHLFDGQEALKYARTRHGDNDYQRGQRQLQVLAAVRERVMSPGALVSLLPKAPDLLDQLRDGIYTDITLDEMLDLGQAALGVPEEAIAMGALNEHWSMIYASPTSGRIRIPDREKLSTLMTQVFGEHYSG